MYNQLMVFLSITKKFLLFFLAPFLRMWSFFFFKTSRTKLTLSSSGLVIGSGSNPKQGWINSDFDFRIAFLDVSKKLPIISNSVVRIYAEHVCEHLTISSARIMFSESYRILTRGGVLRIVVPDLEGHINLYQSQSDERLEYLSDLRSQGFQAEHFTDIIKSFATYWGHHKGYFWDFESLSKELKAAGFLDIKRFSVGQSDSQTLTFLETRTGELDNKLQLIIEVTK
jgi:predicted SAM-dependent methyltransferase